MNVAYQLGQFLVPHRATLALGSTKIFTGFFKKYQYRSQALLSAVFGVVALAAALNVSIDR